MKQKKYQKKNRLKIRNLSSKLIIYNYEKGLLVELNESAKLIWSLLDSKSVEEIIDDYVDFYGIDAKTAIDDVKSVIKELEEKGVIEEKGSDNHV